MVASASSTDAEEAGSTGQRSGVMPVPGGSSAGWSASRRPSARAAYNRAGVWALMFGENPVPTISSAAITPVGPKTGAAIAHSSARRSPCAAATPRNRMVARASRSASEVVIVRPVWAGNRRVRIRCTSVFGANASNAFPAAVACAGRTSLRVRASSRLCPLDQPRHDTPCSCQTPNRTCSPVMSARSTTAAVMCARSAAEPDHVGKAAGSSW
jgi:hypothetical protein